MPSIYTEAYILNRLVDASSDGAEPGVNRGHVDGDGDVGERSSCGVEIIPGVAVGVVDLGSGLDRSILVDPVLVVGTPGPHGGVSTRGVEDGGTRQGLVASQGDEAGEMKAREQHDEETARKATGTPTS
jgi:hypothetical protein